MYKAWLSIVVQKDKINDSDLIWYTRGMVWTSCCFSSAKMTWNGMFQSLAYHSSTKSSICTGQSNHRLHVITVAIYVLFIAVNAWKYSSLLRITLKTRKVYYLVRGIPLSWHAKSWHAFIHNWLADSFGNVLADLNRKYSNFINIQSISRPYCQYRKKN